MLQLSKRGEELKHSPIRKLVPYADKAVKKGIKIFSLNLGQPDVLSPKEGVDALKKADLSIISYSNSAGNYSLRQALADYYKNIDLPITAEDVLITIGGSEALLNVFHCCLDYGDEIIVPQPYYTNYNFFTHTLGIKIVPIDCDIKNGFALPEISEFEKLITNKTKAILINNPNNPTGYVYNYNELEQLGKIALKHNLYLISDEVYREFCYDNLKHISLLSFENLKNNVIIIDSFSKRYSLCGIRVGAIITKNTTLQQTFLKFCQGRISPPSLGQIVAEASLLNTNKSYLEDVRKEYEKRRNILVKALREMDGVITTNPQGAFYCFAEFPIDDSENFCLWLLEKFTYKNSTVMISPGSGFYSNPEIGKRQIRIAYVLKEKELNDAMECLKEALIEYKKIIK